MILIVDDKKENLFSLKALLQLNAYDVDPAGSGEEALKKILKNEYALIILDVQMPDMDGYEVAEIVKGYSKSKNIPIIFLSAVNIDKRFITKGYAAGGVDYVTKPFDPDLLLLKVKTFYKLYEQSRALIMLESNLKEEIENRKAAQEALEEANLLLEDKVRSRTIELLNSNNDLKISNSELQQYAYLASHDLQEPLRKIITYSRIVEERYIVKEEKAESYLQKIISSSERMRNLINDLLDYSKLNIKTAFVLQDLRILINEAITDLELSIKEKNAEVIISHSFPTIDAIPLLLSQVFQNLIGNSLKFSRPGVAPIINIDFDFTDDLSAYSNSSNHGKFVRIFIKDNGIGFNEKYVDKIFTIFQRLHGKQEYEGTGIGLAIVKKIIEKHNGLITAKSTEGEGTTFIILLPLKQHETADLLI